MLLKNAQFVQLHRGVQCGLATKSWQNRIRLLFDDDRLDDLWGNRFDVGCVSEVWVGHDCGRI